MFVRKTVFVLGAGASAPYGYPTGGMLKEKICKGQISDPDMEVLRRVGVHADQLPPFQRAFWGSACDSIDEFLRGRPEFDRIGKSLTALRIIRCENAEVLPTGITDGRGSFRNREAWYDLLLNTMLDNPSNSFRGNRLKVITFNYDLSLEQFFVDALQHRFNMSIESICQQVNSIPIIHIHGTVGSLRQLNPSAVDGRDYDALLPDGTLEQAAKSIRTVSELVTDEIMEEAQEAIRQAEFVFFLGFGFHEMNIHGRLAWLPDQGENSICCGSALGLADGAVARVGRLGIRTGARTDGCRSFLENCIEFVDCQNM